MEFTVLRTSGWAGDGWEVVGVFASRAEAAEAAEAAHRSDARLSGYITAVIGSVRACPDHGPGCVVGDTSRVAVGEAHLRSRRCHIRDTYYS